MQQQRYVVNWFWCGLEFMGNHRTKFCSECAPAAQLRVKLRYMNSPAGRASARRVAASPRGRAVRAVRDAKRRSFVPVPLEVWVRRKVAMETARCVACGAQAEQWDHIVPVAIARLISLAEVDEDVNLQPLCKPCHLVKTKADLKYIKWFKEVIDENRVDGPASIV